MWTVRKFTLDVNFMIFTGIDKKDLKMFSQFQNRIFIEMLFGAFYSTRVGLAPPEISKLTRYSEIPLS